ncbi:MAG: folate family ECF transporter S component [Oscillospiraceae bacterium]|nr:folate family ECF transporter S component [Oscillospiraceae bacterium]
MQKKKTVIATKTLAYCALLAAVSIIMARLLSYAQPGGVRWSLDKFPLFLAGMLFGPLAGGLTGFVADFTGSLMQFGFNPVFCPPAILYGLCGGLFRHFLAKKPSVFRLAISYLPPVVLGSVLYQSAALAWVYSSATFWAAFSANLISRGIQFAVVLVLEVMVLKLLIQTKLFHRLGVWPPIKKDRSNDNDCC